MTEGRSRLPLLDRVALVTGRHPTVWAVVPAVALSLALLLGAASALRSGWLPIADVAFIEMRVRDVPNEFPLLGVYSRFGWNHPGPAEFVLLSIPYRLFGGSSGGLLVGMLALHAAAALAVLRISWPLDRVTALINFSVIGAILVVTPVDIIRSPWNPYVGLVGCLLMVIAAWGVAERRRFASLLFFPLASLLVQVHLVNAFLVLGAAGAAAVGCFWGHRRLSDGGDDHGPGTRWRELAIGALVAAAMWVPPLLAQLRGEDGRLSDLLGRGSGDGEIAGARVALGATFEAFALRPSWARTSSWTEGFASAGLPVPVWLFIAFAGLAVAVHKRDRTFIRAMGVAFTAVAMAGLGAALMRDGFYSYLLVALRGSAAAATALGLGAAALLLPARARASSLVLLSSTATCLAVLVGAQQLGGDNPGQAYGPAVETLTSALLRSDVSGEPIQLSGAELFTSAPGVALQLERAGVDVVLSSPELARAVGSHRAPTDSSSRTQVLIAPLDGADQAESDGWEILGRYVALSPDETERRRSLETRRAAVGERLDRIRAERRTSSPEQRELEWEFMDLGEQLNQLVRDRVELFIASRPPMAASSAGRGTPTLDN
jgi:hypothetical protein